MTRPLAIIGFTSLIVLVAASFLSINVVLVLCCVFAVLFVFLLFIKKFRQNKTLMIALLTGVIALAGYSAVYYFNYLPATALDGQQCVIQGQIVQMPEGESNGRYYYIVETDNFSFNGKDKKIKMRLSSSHELYCQPYDRISAEVKISIPPDNEVNSSRKYYMANDVYLYCYPVDHVKISTPDSKPLMFYAQSIKIKLTDSISSMLSNETAGVLRAIMFGDDSAIEQNDLNAIRKSGIAHMLAVSGLHLSIIASFIFFLLSRFRVNKKISSLVCIVCVFLFMAVTGFSQSVTRAGIMNILYFAGNLIGRRSDPYNSMGLAAIVLLIANPFAAADIGLILSFCATLGILSLQPVLQDKIMSLSFIKRLNAKTDAANDDKPDTYDKFDVDMDNITLQSYDDLVDSIIDLSPEQIIKHRDSINLVCDGDDDKADIVAQNINNKHKAKPKFDFGKMVYRIISYFVGILTCSLSATIFTLPATLTFFDSVSLVAPLSNLVCTLPASIMMVCGQIASVLNTIPIISVLAKPFGFVAGVLAKFILWWCRFISTMPIAGLSTAFAYVKISVGFAMILIALAILLSMRVNDKGRSSKRYYTIAGLLSIIILFGGILSYQVLYNDVTEIAVINQDDSSSLVIMENGKAVVIGCGGAYNADQRIIDLLSSRGIYGIDLLFIPKSDQRFGSNSCQLIDQYPVKAVIAKPDGDYYDAIMDKAFFSGCDINDLCNATVSLWDEIELEIMLSGDDMLVTITDHDTSLLYATQDADIMLLPEDERTFNMVIYDNELPANYHMIEEQSAIISGETKTSAVAMLRLKQRGTNGFLLCDYDRLIIQTRGKGDITLRQE